MGFGSRVSKSLSPFGAESGKTLRASLIAAIGAKSTVLK